MELSSLIAQNLEDDPQKLANLGAVNESISEPEINKRIVDGNYDNLRERFIGQGLGQDQVANRRLDNLICRRYRNLEGDLFLPVQDYEGRTRPIETKILLKEKNIGGGVNEFILENTPYIGDMVQNPTDWLVYNITTHGNPQTLSVKVLTCEYIGDYEGSTNCCRITVNMDIANLVVGYHVGILSWKAKGLVLNYTPAFPIDIDGHGRTYCVGASWYDSINNIYRALVSVEYASNPIGKRTCIKTYRSTDRLIGAWTQDNIDAVDDFADLIPETHKGFTQFSGFAKYPGSSGLMFCMIGLYDDTVELRTPYGTCTQVAILIFNEDLSHKRIIIPTLDYVFENRLNIHSYGSSITHYKGRYVMSIHDGGSVLVWPEEEAGKRVMLSSKNIEGPYSFDSTIIDLDDEWVNMVGSPINQAVANGQIFVFNGDLYYLLFGAAIQGTSGSLERHEGFLFKYNDSTKTWALTIPGPILTALFGHSSNYPELNLTWGNVHMGSSTFHYIEGNKLWMCFAATGGRYASSIGYIDLDKALS